MKEFKELTKFIIAELNTKCGISEADIGLLDSGTVDLVEDVLEFDFCISKDNYLYTFMHDYQNNIGKLTKSMSTDAKQEETIVRSWGDWSIYEGL